MENSQKGTLRQTILAILLTLLLVVLSFAAGVLASNYLPIFFSVGNYPQVNQTISLLKEYFYGQMPEKQDLQYGMIHGMLQKVGDPYTILVEPVQNELQTNQLSGSYGGLGARLEWNDEGQLLLYPFPDSAAQKGGVQDGDRLLAVDDLQIQPSLSTEEIQAAIRGEVGSKVQITIIRPPSDEEIVLEVVREEVALPSTTWNLTSQNDKVGIIQINVIAATTPDEVRKAVDDLLQQGAQYFILDLRNNSGGLLDAGTEVAGLFLKAGVVIEEQYRGKPVDQIGTEQDGPYIDLPLAVLINQNSASAAEIIAGALKGRQRAELIGTPSYGKDTIQLVFDLHDGSSVHVTTAQWWIPGLGYSIHEQGLQPDIVVSDQDTDPQAGVAAAVQQLLQ